MSKSKKKFDYKEFAGNLAQAISAKPVHIQTNGVIEQASLKVFSIIGLLESISRDEKISLQAFKHLIDVVESSDFTKLGYEKVPTKITQAFFDGAGFDKDQEFNWQHNAVNRGAFRMLESAIQDMIIGISSHNIDHALEQAQQQSGQRASAARVATR